MVQYNLLDTIAVIEIGTMVSVFLFGVSVVQAYLYFASFPGDHFRLKALVASVITLELGHTIAVLHAFYTISVKLYNRPDLIFANTPAGIAVATLLSGYIACLVQVFFANRMKEFAHRRYLTFLCWTLSALRAIATTATTVVMSTNTLTRFTEHWGWLVGTTLIIGAVVDIIIAVGLCYDLYQKRNWGDTFTRTTKTLDRAILMTIQTGLLTSVMTLAVTVCFIVVVDSFIWVGIYVCLARVFSNTLLATLNYRKTLREIFDQPPTLNMPNFTCTTGVRTQGNPPATHITLDWGKQDSIESPTSFQSQET
ncbi:hypothetical protein ONZ45_g10321 [Pleurotus djamor]|nr:hypothetical protein ONZ45_g10321 [Pleurotus djamor]